MRWLFLSLVVVAIAAAYIVTCVPVGGNTRERAKSTAALANAIVLTRAYLLYIPDRNGKIPSDLLTATELQKRLGPHVDIRVFENHNPNGSEFIPNAFIAGKRLADLGPREQVIVLYESRPWPDGTQIRGYADGHVSRHAAAPDGSQRK